MNTLLLDAQRIELAKAAAGKSELYRINVIENIVTGQVYIPDSNNKHIVNCIGVVYTAISEGDVLFIDYGTHVEGRYIITIDEINDFIIVDEPYTTVIAVGSPKDISKGYFNFMGILKGFWVGDDGYDTGINQPKIITGDLTDLFNPLLYKDFDEVLWLGDTDNLAVGEDLQPYSVLCRGTLEESELVGEAVNEVGVQAEFYDSQDGSVKTKIIGMATFSTKYKDNTDVFEITLKVNY